MLSRHRRCPAILHAGAVRSIGLTGTKEIRSSAPAGTEAPAVCPGRQFGDPTSMTTLLAGTEAPSVLYERPHWYACYTHGRHEKRVASRLEEAGIESYLPVRMERRRWTDRVREVKLPIFPSYVFGRFRLGALRQVLDVPGVATTVRVGRSPYPTPIPDSDIEHVRVAAEQARLLGSPRFAGSTRE